MNTKLCVDTDKVLKALRDNPSCRETFELLFPGITDESKYFDLAKLVSNKELISKGDYSLFTNDSSKKAGFDNDCFLQIRKYGNLANKSFYLSNLCNWEIVKDADGKKCLLPTKKI